MASLESIVEGHLSQQISLAVELVESILRARHIRLLEGELIGEARSVYHRSVEAAGRIRDDGHNKKLREIGRGLNQLGSLLDGLDSPQGDRRMCSACPSLERGLRLAQEVEALHRNRPLANRRASSAAP